MKRQPDRERGATLVEFALILPVFMALVLGTFTGGLAYNRKLSITAAAREAARYGATLPVPTDSSNPCAGLLPSNSGAAVQKWLRCVSAVAVRSSDNDLAIGVSGRQVCVANVSMSTSSPPAEVVNRRVEDAAGGETFPAGLCYPDDLGGQSRVQVEVRRQSKLEALFFTWSNLTLRSRSTTRLEQ